MNFTPMKKYFRQSDYWPQSIIPHQRGILCLLLLGLFWGNGQPACATLLYHQSNSISSIQPLLISQSSLPPSVEAAIRQDLSRRTSLKEGQFILQQSSRQTWPDGCLGLGGNDELCTQAFVNGWRVVMEYQDKMWVYRTDDTGMAVRLEQ
ncbi:MAG: hypothetical protein AB4041_03010 [Microcystaceae cyanobacterium]